MTKSNFVAFTGKRRDIIIMSFENEQQITLKKISYRAHYRGTKESELLFGKFIQDFIEEFNAEELKELEKLVDWSEFDLYELFTEKRGGCKLSASLQSKIHQYTAHK